jgi:hypothetical protein
MFTLATDVQKIIMEFLEPQEIKALYESCENSKFMFDELTKHTNFIVDCKRIIINKELKWFELKNIKIKLLVTYKNQYGNQYWYKNGRIHRDNGPAKIWSNGDQHWYKNGRIHRDNLPAIILASGEQCWYKDGLQHRDNDLPAIINQNGSQYWYKNDLLHRDNGPAIILANGDQYWYQNGNYHRDNDLPAIIELNGHQLWYKNGKKYIPNKN